MVNPETTSERHGGGAARWLAEFAVRVFRFGIVSALGLVLDYAIFALLVEAGFKVGCANAVSASAGVTFVFLVATRHVFESDHGYRVKPFAVYAVYQLFAVAAASAAVGWLDAVLDGRHLLAKTLMLPVTFAANFLFMSWLLSRGPGRPPAAADPA